MVRTVPLLLGILALSTGCGGGLHSGGGGGGGSGRASPEFLRKNTVSIYVEAPDRIATLFEGIAERMQAKGKGQLASFFASQTGGAFGSGFLVRKNGEMLVITNRHVVDFADEAVVALEGSEKPYPVEVVYTDRVYDLAVLAFKEAPPEGLPGMRLEPGGVHDLETVVATGFPGLDGQPSYQATRGQVSNERFTAQSHGESISLIQHTAPIDPGSSGGPLMSENGRVVGVNFVKYTGRDNVYLAIPAAAVSKVLDSAYATKTGRKEVKWLTTRLGESCGRLVGGLRHANEPTVDVYDLVTNDAIVDQGFASLDAVGKTDKEIWTAFFENPTQTMRVAVAYRLWKEAHGKEGLPVTCLPLEQDAESATVKLLVKFERGDRETFWRFEQGAWKLAGFDRMNSQVPVAPPPSKPAGKPRAKPRR